MSGEVPSATTPLKLYELECTGGVWATYKRRDVNAPQAGGAVDYAKLCEIIAASKHCDPDILMLFDGSITCDPNVPEAVRACLKDDFVPVRNAVTFYVKPPAPPVAVAPPAVDASSSTDDGLAEKLMRSEVASAYFSRASPIPPPYGPPDSLLERESQIKDAADYIKATLSTIRHARASKFHTPSSNKVSAFGISGMPGIGKTALLSAIHYKLMAAWKAGAPVDGFPLCVPIFVTFNGSTTDAARKLASRKSPLQGFATVALSQCLQQQDLQLVPDIQFESFVDNYCKHVVKARDDVPVVFLVDELCLVDVAEALFTDLMARCDWSATERFRHICVFIFSHLSHNWLVNRQTKSGRPTSALSMPPLSLSAWSFPGYYDQLVATVPEIVEDEKLRREVHQLLLLAGGHPRTLFEAIPGVLPKINSAKSAFSTSVLGSLLVTTKSIPISLEKPVIDHFALLSQRSAEDLDLLRQHGILAENGDCCFLQPLQLYMWGSDVRTGMTSLFGQHIVRLIDADREIFSEKRFEAIMTNFEAIRRLATVKKDPTMTFALSQYYAHAQNGLQDDAQVRLLVRALVSEVVDFTKHEDVLRELRKGSIVVSKKVNEEGVEYLVPFVLASAVIPDTGPRPEDLVIAAVQCKFVLNNFEWEPAKVHMSKAIVNIKNIGTFAHVFPVYFTTRDVHASDVDNVSGAIVYSEKSLFRLTSCLGILRMHTEKLGAKLAREHPWLNSAAASQFLAGLSEAKLRAQSAGRCDVAAQVEEE